MSTSVQGALRECCAQKANRILASQRFVRQANGKVCQARVELCGVCGRRHHRLAVDVKFEPGKVTVG
jgi:hypothetical protein